MILLYDRNKTIGQYKPGVDGMLSRPYPSNMCRSQLSSDDTSKYKLQQVLTISFIIQALVENYLHEFVLISIYSKGHPKCTIYC